MTEATLNIPTLETKQIEQLYTFQDREPGEVLQFIEKYSFLVPLLLEAPQKIYQFFPDAPLTLTVHIDPESYFEEDIELVLLIETDMDPEESVDVLEEFDYAWGIEASDRSKGKLLIDLQ